MAQLASVDIAIIVAYFIVTLAAGLILSRRAGRNIESYFLGRRRLPWWLLGVSGMASNLDMAGTMVITSFLFLLGMGGFWVALRGGIALALAFLMIYLGKWLRRSQVMTNAEWMEFRFGGGKGGEVSRILSVISTLTLTIGMIAYFAVGAGKFLSLFLPFSSSICALILISVAAVYVMASGFYGVIFTDLIQAVILGFVAIYLSVVAFTTADISIASEGWGSIAPSWHISLPPDYQVYELFGMCILFWATRAILESLGGPTSGYVSQRFYAARNDRECGLFSLMWTLLFSIRWPMMMGIALLGITLVEDIQDPEMTLPMVISYYIPVGFMGLVLVALIAAAMSTFDSTVNAGASYLVRDVFQRFIKPNASTRELVYSSYLSSIFIIVLGTAIGLMVPRIDAIWSWIAMGLCAGLVFPLLLRWYWWRFNGWGFAAGTVAGLAAAIFQGIFFPDLPIYISFPIISGISFIASVVVPYFTPSTEEKVLVNFYCKVRPFGIWKPVQSSINPDLRREINSEGKRDLSNLFLAIPWQICLFLTPMYLVIHNFLSGIICLVLLVFLSVGLYFRWYKFLPPGSEG